MSNALEAYDEWHDRHEVDVSADAPWHKTIRQRLRFETDIKDKKILEIGCGRGGFSCWLATQNPKPERVFAADFSPVAVEKGRQFSQQKGIDNIEWMVRDIENLPDADSTYDTIFSYETIEHVPNPPKAVKEMARVLKPGGRMYLTTPNYMSTIGLYRVYCWARGKKFDEGGQPICHVTMLPKTRGWVKAAGLRIVESLSTGQYLPFPGRPPIEMPWMDSLKPVCRWFGLHSAIIAEKPETHPK